MVTRLGSMSGEYGSVAKAINSYVTLIVISEDASSATKAMRYNLTSKLHLYVSAITQRRGNNTLHSPKGNEYGFVQLHS